jgi:nucleoside-diphosphate-sugar epimerase
MRVFVTGATGFIGEAVVRELRAAGHEVLGLARSDQSAEVLARMGVTPHRGEVADLDSLAAGARACDGVIHLAFIHDFSRYQANAETDRRALEAMADALEGSGKPLVSTSGTSVLAPGGVGTESDAPSPQSPGHIRAASEVVLAAAERGVRVSTVRLPPSVHGRGDHGFVPALIDLARRAGAAAFIGEGANRWPAVHRLDAARLFRLALEGAAPGARLHGVAEEGIPMRAIAEAIGAGLGVPVQSLTEEEAVSHFGWMARFVAIDNPVSSAVTRDWLDWYPREVGLLQDLQTAGYFA